jgi:hypothetical protein
MSWGSTKQRYGGCCKPADVFPCDLSLLEGKEKKNTDIRIPEEERRG